MKQAFSNMSIKAKIFSGFAAALAILLVVAGTGYTGLVTVSQEVEEMNELVEDGLLVAKIEADFLKLRTHAREFANKGRDADAEGVHALQAKIAPDIQKALKNSQRHPEMTKRLQHLEKEFKIYMVDFEKAAGLEREFQHLILKELEPAGEKIIKDLDAFMAEAQTVGNTEAVSLVANAREHALLARLYANILIGRQDDSFGAKTQHEFEAFAAALKTLDGSVATLEERRLLTEVTELFKVYEATFEKVHKDEQALRHLVDGEMKEAGQKLAADAEWILDRSLQLEHELRDETEGTIIATEIEMIVIGLAGILIGVALSFFLGRNVSDSVQSMTAAMRRLADNDLEVEIPAQGRGDEIGEMAVSVQVFKENAIERVRLEQEAEEQRRQQKLREEEERAAEAMRQQEEMEREKREREAEAERERLAREAELKQQEAEREAERQAERQKAEEQERRAREERERAEKISALTSRFDGSVTSILKNVGSAVHNLDGTSGTLNTTAKATTSQVATVSAAAEQTSSNVQMVAAAAEELTQSINEISQQVNRSTAISTEAVAKADETNQRVRSLAEAASKINEVVDLINDIAGRTNLLALNATIEAARAGEAGKGFAVVASEVGNLANQTGKATEDIATLVAAIQAATDDSVEAIDEITQTIGNVHEIATSIASAVEEQGAATEEIARNVEQAATGTQEVADNIVQVSTAANDTGSAADDMSSAVVELNSEAAMLRTEVETFLQDIAAV